MGRQSSVPGGAPTTNPFEAGLGAAELEPGHIFSRFGDSTRQEKASLDPQHREVNQV